MDDILWILWIGAHWKDLLEHHPSYHTYHRRFQQRILASVFEPLLQALATDLCERGRLDLVEATLSNL